MSKAIGGRVESNFYYKVHMFPVFSVEPPDLLHQRTKGQMPVQAVYQIIYM